jgi:hypothetical protein
MSVDKSVNILRLVKEIKSIRCRRRGLIISIHNDTHFSEDFVLILADGRVTLILSIYITQNYVALQHTTGSTLVYYHNLSISSL